MRALLLIVLGLVIGAMGATFAISALHQGTPFHSGIMSVMQHHMGALRANVRANRCEGKASAMHLGRMREDAGDIGEAFGDMDAGFAPAAARLTQAIDGALAARPDACPALQVALEPVAAACQSCHQHYR